MKRENIINKGEVLDNDNPLIIKSNSVDDALLSIFHYAIIAAKENNLDEEETSKLLKLIKDAYLVRRAKYYFNNKTDQLNNILQIMNSFINKQDEDKDFSSAYYYNRITKHSVEQ